MNDFNYLHVVWEHNYTDPVVLRIRLGNRAGKRSIEYPVPGPRVSLLQLCIF